VILQNYWGGVNKNLPLLSIISLFFAFFLSNNAFGETEADGLGGVITRAKIMQLAEKPAWLNLLHYKSTLLGGYESQADDPAFFLAKTGKLNAQAELEADLRGFFSDKASAHPRCMFPARFYWLNQQLNFSEQLPIITCQPFIEWQEKINAKQLTLLFPSMHMDSPASMFGHTSIRFDRPDGNILLSYALSYAASYSEADSILLYSWKGITGGYPGKFFLQPYYEALKDYSEIEQRDIWEYELNLTPQEVDQFLRHYWEIKNIHFDYYFFRENCSFRLLAMLDVARENINMSQDAHPFYAIPVDTVRDIEAAGLVGARNYRPSAYNKILQMTEHVGDEAAQAAIALSQNKLTIDAMAQQFSVNQQINILQLTDEYLKQDETTSIEKSDMQINILSARSRLDAQPEDIVFEFKGVKPETSHQTARWQFSAGNFRANDSGLSNQRNEFGYYEIGLRPAFHDLLDVPTGFIRGSAITVFDTQFRWVPEQDKISLNALNFFSLQSIVPIQPWDSSASKKVSFKLKQRNINVDNQFTEFEMQYSIGYATELSDFLVYAMAKTQFEYAKSLKDNHGFYAGLDAGLLWVFDTTLASGQMTFNYQLLAQITGEPSDIQKLNLGVQFNLFQNNALRLEYEKTEYDVFETTEAKLSYLIYF